MRKHVLSIQSHVVHGYVGNQAASFPFQLWGFEFSPINTVSFSNHTGYGRFKGRRARGEEIQELFDGLKENDLIKEISHVIMGYVGNAEVLKVIGKNIQALKAFNPKIIILIDPVLGDNRKLYCPAECIPIYQELCRMADIITPNGSEAFWLSGLDSESPILDIIHILHELGPKKVVITSINEQKGLFLYASCLKTGTVYQIDIPKIKGHFTGTGDTFSALLLVHLDLVESIGVAVEKACDSLTAILRKTIEIRGGVGELAIVQSSKEILEPPPLVTAKIFHQAAVAISN